MYKPSDNAASLPKRSCFHSDATQISGCVMSIAAPKILCSPPFLIFTAFRIPNAVDIPMQNAAAMSQFTPSPPYCAV